MQRQLRHALTIITALALLLTWNAAVQGAKGAGATAPPQVALSGGITPGVAAALDFAVYLPSVFKSFAAPTCTPPTLISPANGRTLSTISVEYIWNDGDDPAGTIAFLRIARDAAFTQGAGSLRSTVRGEHQFRFSTNLSPGTTYYWRAFNQCGEIMSPYSEIWSFTTGSGGTVLPAPLLVAPANGSVMPGTSATLQWSPVSGAIEYLLRYRTLGESGYTYDFLDATQMPFSALAPNTTYEWWVSARNDYAIGADSPQWTFTTGPAPGRSSIPDLLPHRGVQDGSAIVVVEERAGW